MNIVFFIFPFLLYLGIALQGISYYTIGLLIPSVYFLIKRKKIPAYFAKIGFIFIMLHIIFPIINFLVYFFPNLKVDASIYNIALQWPGILKSNFPSSLFFGGIALILFQYISKKKFHSHNFQNINCLEYKNDSFQPLKYFLLGLAPASLCFVSLMLFSHFTGLDLHTLFRKKIGYMSQNDAFNSGGYRVFGFYGHPLSVAGVCLAYSVFSCASLCLFYANRDKYTWKFIPFSSHKFLPLMVFMVIVFSNMISLFLSGGRTAAVIGIFFIVLMPLGFNLRKNYVVTLFAVSLITIISFFSAQNLGILNRIQLTTSSLIQHESLDSGNNRAYFWKIYKQMFTDSPIIGQGSYWIKQGVSKEYYNMLGLRNLSEKYNAHNVYLETLGSTGIIGFSWILVSLFFLIQTLKRYVFSKSKEFQLISIAFVLAFLANLLHGVTQNVFFDSSVVYIYICFILVFLWESAEGVL